MEISRRKILYRRSPSQEAKQQNARKTASRLRGYRTEVLRKISAIKVWTELRPELRPESRPELAHKSRRMETHICRQNGAINGASSDQGSEISSRSVFSTKSDVETGKMNTAARRNRFYAKRRTERMKRRGFGQKSGSSYYLCVVAGLRSNLRRFATLIPEVESPDGRILRSIGEREYGRSAASRMGPDVDNRVEGFDPIRAC